MVLQGNGIPQLAAATGAAWDLPNSEFTLPGFYSHTAACGILNGNARRNRISALRRGAGWYDRDKTQRQTANWLDRDWGILSLRSLVVLPLQLPSRVLPLTFVPGQLPLSRR